VTLYCAVSPARGAGLGTALFPWARCKLFSKATGAPMLAPTWTRLRLGPLLRGGTSLGAYHRQILLWNQFISRPVYVRGLRRAWLLTRARRLSEEEARRTPPTTASAPTLVTFRGYGRLFEDLYPQRQFLLSELRAEANPRQVALAGANRAPIAINVRCGNEFQAAASPEDYLHRGALRTPIEWFVETLELIRARVDCDVPAVVVSDGCASQLKELLARPNVSFARPGAALGDLFTLAQSRVLLASGGSSFSAWGAFLADALTLSHPGQSMSWFGVRNTRGLYVGAFEPRGGVTERLADQLRAALRGWVGRSKEPSEAP